MGQYRDKFYADNAGLPYTFPPLESKKRKRPTAPIEPSTRKPRSAGIAALTRVSALPRSRSSSEDSDSNTSSANEANEVEDWAIPRTQRISRRRRSLRHNDMYAATEDGEMFGPAEEEEEWVRYKIHTFHTNISQSRVAGAQLTTFYRSHLGKRAFAMLYTYFSPSFCSLRSRKWSIAWPFSLLYSGSP